MIPDIFQGIRIGLIDGINLATTVIRKETRYGRTQLINALFGIVL